MCWRKTSNSNFVEDKEVKNVYLVNVLNAIEKSMIICDNTKAAEGLGIFFKNLGRSSKAGKNLATNMFKNPSRALQIGVKIGTVAVSEFPKAALCTIPGVITFYHTGK